MPVNIPTDITISSETVQFTSDKTPINAFFARPSKPAKLIPGVVIIHEWWGLNDHIKDIARRFAKAGYAALAPDLYARQGSKVAADANEASKLMSGLSSQSALRDLNAAVTCLKAQPSIDGLRLATVGFCMGGTLALTMAGHNSELKAAVVFYGKVPPIESFKYLLCPILYHYGEQDDWVTTQEVQRLRDGLAQFGKPGEVVTYPAPHAFFNDTRPDVYRKDLAENAWQKTLQFLQHHLS